MLQALATLLYARSTMARYITRHFVTNLSICMGCLIVILMLLDFEDKL